MTFPGYFSVGVNKSLGLQNQTNPHVKKISKKTTAISAHNRSFESLTIIAQNSSMILKRSENIYVHRSGKKKHYNDQYLKQAMWSRVKSKLLDNSILS